MNRKIKESNLIFPMFKCKYIQHRKSFWSMLYYPKVYKELPLLTLQTKKDNILVVKKENFKKRRRLGYNTPNFIPKKSNLVKLEDSEEGDFILFIYKQFEEKSRLDYIVNDKTVFPHHRKIEFITLNCARLFICDGLFSPHLPIVRCCFYDYKHYYVIFVGEIVVIACFCGFVQLWEAKKKELVSKFYNKKEEDHYPNYRIISMVSTSKDTFAIGNNKGVIKVWQIKISEDDKYYCSCICTMYGQNAVILRHDPINNSVLAAGNDSTIRCYQIDNNLNGQWFLNIVVEDVTFFDTGNEKFLKEYEQIARNEPDPNDSEEDAKTEEKFYKSEINKMYIRNNGDIIGLKKNGDVFNLLKI